MAQQTRILVVGGGFGGVMAALELTKRLKKRTAITLVSAQPHLTLYPYLYLVATGKTAASVAIPLRDIFEKTRVTWVVDEIIDMNFAKNRAYAKSGSAYDYDYVILALGSEPTYHQIAGLLQHGFPFFSTDDALKVHSYLHAIVTDHISNFPDRLMALKIVVIGGGSTGVELASELAQYIRTITLKHKKRAQVVQVVLVEAFENILPSSDKDARAQIVKRLQHLGVLTHCNRPLQKIEAHKLLFADETMHADMIIWAGGVTTHHLLKEFGLSLNKVGKARVDEYLRSVDHNNMFVIGDNAASPDSGFVQSAMVQGRYVGVAIDELLQDYLPKRFTPQTPKLIVPAGSNWSLAEMSGFRLSGGMGWYAKRWNDLKLLMSILPRKKAYDVWRMNDEVHESCTLCSSYE